MKFLLVVLLLGGVLQACNPGNDAGTMLPTRSVQPRDTLVFAFYNVENLFDATDDPRNPGDDEFLPDAPRHWTDRRLERKLGALARAIRAIDRMRGPDVIGLAEVENRAVLDRLAGEFLPRGYHVAHVESPDERGIDAAILYRDPIRLRRLVAHRVVLPHGDRTRDVLEASLQRGGLNFTVIANHWPSRYGGQEESEPLRAIAARVARRVVDSLMALDSAADIVLMGDLNDEPFDRSVREVLGAHAYDGPSDARGNLIDLAAPVAETDTIGSYYYHHDWETIDHLIVSPGLLDDRGLMLLETSERVFAPEFLRDDRAGADRPPLRTYKGTMYIGGASDHFPVWTPVGISATR